MVSNYLLAASVDWFKLYALLNINVLLLFSTSFILYCSEWWVCKVQMLQKYYSIYIYIFAVFS